ncbi:Ankyrin repeat-containing protein [Vitis vinifera]|uniref:Ankyrin repeat-containing protein n=1 Tax=Vitis vinifera TaxID=29760 RepID=A0A438DW68_VITVI|nr:Ankyrin repeat-containing protein [Vitis vinifera]
MEAPARQQSFRRKNITKQLTGKRDDTSLHSAARAGNLELALDILSKCEDAEALKELLSKQNQSGETALYVAAEYGHCDLVKEMMEYYDVSSAGIQARNGYDAFHIAAKQGDLGKPLWILPCVCSPHMSSWRPFPETSMTVDLSNTTALHTAAAQGAFEGCEALLSKEPGISTRTDKKGQTALHMAVKGQNIEVVDELMKSDPSLINMVDAKDNTTLHVAVRKCRAQIVQQLLSHKATDTEAINKSGETALDTAEKTGHAEITTILQEHGVKSQYADDPEHVPPGLSPGEANIAPRTPFMLFFIFDSLALFISLAVVVVQTSIVERWLAVGVTGIGTVIMATTLGTMCYWVIVHRIEAKKSRSIRRSTMSSRSRSSPMSVMSDSEILNNEYKKLYAI